MTWIYTGTHTLITDHLFTRSSIYISLTHTNKIQLLFHFRIRETGSTCMQNFLIEFDFQYYYCQWRVVRKPLSNPSPSDKENVRFQFQFLNYVMCLLGLVAVCQICINFFSLKFQIFLLPSNYIISFTIVWTQLW